MTGTHVIEVVVQDVVVANVALGVNHRVGIFLTVLADILTTIFKIGVEHTFQFNTHHVTPLGFLREIQQIALGIALHLTVGHPLRIVLVRSLEQGQRTVDEQAVEVDVAGLATHKVAALDTVEVTVLDIDVVNKCIFVETDNLHTILRLLTGNILHIYVANDGVVATAANLVVLVVEINLQDALLTLANGDVTHVDILDDTTTAAVGLDTQHALQLWRIHHTIVSIHILATA